MLKYLRIQNFAIIDNVEIEFGPGLNIITGETGTGKSIIMDALNIILGSRASSDLIRTGANSASVEALFEVGDQESLQAAAEMAGIDIGSDELIVRRIIQHSGKSRAFVNDTMVNVGTLAHITERLVDLCSQGDQQLLGKHDERLFWLDRFGDTGGIRNFVKEKFQSWRAKSSELTKLETNTADRERHTDFLRFQIKELEEAKIAGPNEDDEIKAELEVLSNSETLSTFAREAEEAIYGSNAENTAMMDTLGILVNRAEELVKTDEKLLPAFELMNSLKVTLEEAGYFFRDYNQSITVDDERLELLNRRYAALGQLKRKYGPTLEEVLESMEIFSSELNSFANHNESLQVAKAALHEARELFDIEAASLTEKRVISASTFGHQVESELAELNMDRAKFLVEMDKLNEPSVMGLDSVDFLVSANPGEPPQQIHKVASGGELSRIMLALQNVISAKGGVRVYLFDEVDTGIGGKTAAIVGKKLQKVAQNGQVICITHLPQVASFGNHHLRVEKSIVNEAGEERTVCSVVPLTADDKVLEIARMLGGMDENNEEALANAESMIATAQSGGPQVSLNDLPDIDLTDQDDAKAEEDASAE